jgi:hypothetical protein
MTAIQARVRIMFDDTLLTVGKYTRPEAAVWLQELFEYVHGLPTLVEYTTEPGVTFLTPSQQRVLDNALRCSVRILE